MNTLKVESNSCQFSESKADSFDVSGFQPISVKSAEFVNKFLTELHYPNYSNYEQSGRKYVSSCSDQKALQKLDPSLDLSGRVDCEVVRRLMEQNSPKLPGDLKAEQTQLKSVDARIAHLQAEIQKTKSRGEPYPGMWMSIGEGFKLDVASAVVVAAISVIIPAIIFACAVNPLFALMLLGLLLIAAAVYLAPTDGNLLKAELANKEKLTKTFDQDVEKNTQFYRGELSAEVIKEFDAQIQEIDGESAKSPRFTSYRIDRLEKREKLVKAKAELEQMVEFFKIKAEAKVVSSKDSPITEIFEGAVLVDSEKSA